MTDSEKKVQEIIEAANKATIEIYKESTSDIDKMRLQNEFLKLHLKNCLDTIAFKESVIKTTQDFYTKALEIKLK